MSTPQSKLTIKSLQALQLCLCILISLIAFAFIISLKITWHKVDGNPKEFASELLNGDCGYIDDKGDLILDLRTKDPPIILGSIPNDVGDFDHGRVLISERGVLDRRSRWLTLDGKQIVLPAKAKHIGPLCEGLARFAIFDKSRSNSHGYLDQSGKIALRPQWKEAGDFSQGFAPVCIFKEPKILDHWGYIDKTGKLAIGARYHGAAPFSEGLAVVKLGTKYGAIDRSGKEIIPTDYNDVYACSEGMIVADKYKSKNSYANAGEIEPIDLERYYFDQSGHLKFTKQMHFEPEERPFGYPSKFFPQTIFWKKKLRYDLNADPSYFCNRAPIKVKDKYGYIDKTGEVVIAPAYDFAFSFSEGRAAVLKNGLLAFIDENGNQITDFTYKAAQDFSEGKAAVLRTSELRWGFIDKSGKVVIAPRFSNTHSFHSGRALVGTAPKMSLLDH